MACFESLLLYCCLGKQQMKSQKKKLKLDGFWNREAMLDKSEKESLFFYL